MLSKSLSIIALATALMTLIPVISAKGSGAVSNNKRDDQDNKDDKGKSYPSYIYNFDYLFTITYAFGQPSPIIYQTGITENINSVVGGTLEGPAFNGHITKGVITNKFAPYYDDSIVFEEATWYGYFDNGDKGNGTFIAETSGLVDFEAYEQQRVKLTVTPGDYDWLQYSYILCGSIAFDLRAASAKQDCFRTYYGEKVALPPVFP
ncbi:hypothetical protein L486_00694 [Kwoniella mangroviensis CBS 10435]|uniref:DM13 domain-containing protein n=1 Tax=Kwoniella mangroviensis CBS 10435 TaxID=1331196 RepID=A0A1B9IZT6_9TREE|nr:hypothetical protein L486_00694 [Kwoniella mangroviensis CBS 10435]